MAYPVQLARLSVAQASFVALLQKHQLLDSVTLSFFHLSFFGVQLFWYTSKNFVTQAFLPDFPQQASAQQTSPDP